MGRRTVSALELVPNIRLFTWPTAMSFHTMKKKRNWFKRQSMYHLDIVEFSSTKFSGSNIVKLNKGWKLFFSGVDVTMSAQTGIGIFVRPCLAPCVLIGFHSEERLVSLSLGYKSSYCAFCRCTHHTLKHNTSIS